ncbi:MAG: hypothetical protein EBR82_75785 [Caulobacteraceae bacterium]|nr:hypothetical protein [Caulobacteraceae bacterium]
MELHIFRVMTQQQFMHQIQLYMKQSLWYRLRYFNQLTQLADKLKVLIFSLRLIAWVGHFSIV